MTAQTTVVDVRLPSGVAVDAHSFVDISPCPVTLRWLPNGVLRMEFAAVLTQSQERRARIRAVAADADHEALLLEAAEAIPANLLWLDGTQPASDASVVGQVQALTRQLNVLLELATRS